MTVKRFLQIALPSKSAKEISHGCLLFLNGNIVGIDVNFRAVVGINVRQLSGYKRFQTITPLLLTLVVLAGVAPVKLHFLILERSSPVFIKLI